MGFVQIIEFRTSKIEEMMELGRSSDPWDSSDNTARRGVVCQDRDDPGRYFNIVFFDSYEDAMKNSNRPEIHEMSEKMGALGDGPPTFYNLDVIEEFG